MKIKLFAFLTLTAIFAGCSANDNYIGTWIGSCGGGANDTIILTKLNDKEYLMKDKDAELKGNFEDNKIKIDVQGQKAELEYIKSTGHLLVTAAGHGCEYHR